MASKSSDLHPIQNLWSNLTMQQRGYFALIKELISNIEDEWFITSNDLYQKLVLSM